MKKIFLYITSIFIFIPNLWAQNIDSIDNNAFENLPLFNIWFYSNNPATDEYRPYLKVLKTDINYAISSGDFHNVTSPNSSDAIAFNTEGYKKTKSFNFYGKFNYHYKHLYDLNYNNTLFISPDNPFIYIDTIPNKDFTAELYHLNGRVTYHSPNLRNIFSLDFNYTAGNKYCESDPRADVNSSKATLNSGFIHSFPNKWAIGGNINFCYFSEEIEELIVAGNNNYTFFKMRRLEISEFKEVDSETTELYEGYNTAIGLQCKYSDKNKAYLTELKINRNFETSQNGITSSVFKTGDYFSTHAGIKQLLRLKHHDINHDFALNMDYNVMKGKWFYQKEEYDYNGLSSTTVYKVIKEAIVYEKTRFQTNINYKLSKIENNRVNYYASLGSQISIEKTDCYPYPYYEDINNMKIYLVGYKDFQYDKGELSIKLNASYKYNLSKDIYIGNSELDNIITLPEYAYLSSNNIRTNGEIKYRLKSIGQSTIKPYAQLNGSYTQIIGSNDYYSGCHRLFVNLGIGIML